MARLLAAEFIREIYRSEWLANLIGITGNPLGEGFDYRAAFNALDLDAVTRAAARAPLPTGVRRGAELARMLRAAAPFTDNDAARSPVPPQLGAWRVR